MKHPEKLVITISRQMGSGGSYVGHLLAKRTGAFYADRGIIRKTAKKLEVLEEEVESRDEKILSFWEFLLHPTVIIDEYVPPELLSPTDRELFDSESEVIEHIAKTRSAVIIGRCGFHVLRDYPAHVRIFLHASRDFRAARLQTVHRLSKDDAEKLIVKSDKDRAEYCETFTGKNWIDARNYDLSIDSGAAGNLDKVAELILSYVKLRGVQY
jgi:cytidylate kinase